MTKTEILKMIHTQCIECMGGHVQEVAKCTAPQCTLFPLRMGRDPSPCRTKGKNLQRLFTAKKACVEQVS
jgi:hypothetical protein